MAAAAAAARTLNFFAFRSRRLATGNWKLAFCEGSFLSTFLLASRVETETRVAISSHRATLPPCRLAALLRRQLHWGCFTVGFCAIKRVAFGCLCAKRQRLQHFVFRISHFAFSRQASGKGTSQRIQRIQATLQCTPQSCQRVSSEPTWPFIVYSQSAGLLASWLADVSAVAHCSRAPQRRAGCQALLWSG